MKSLQKVELLKKINYCELIGCPLCLYVNTFSGSIPLFFICSYTSSALKPPIKETNSSKRASVLVPINGIPELNSKFCFFISCLKCPAVSIFCRDLSPNSVISFRCKTAP